MTNEFANWLVENGLEELITTNAGDTLYINRDKKFGVLKKHGELNVNSFYLDDIVEIKTYDDEHPVAEWSCMSPLFAHERSTRHSANEVYMKIRMKNQSVLRLQIFRATKGNIPRDSNGHVNLIGYSVQVTRMVSNAVVEAIK